MTFPLESPSPVPRTSHTGKSIRLPIIKSMEKQFAAECLVSAKLDELLETISKIDSDPPPPPEGSRYRSSMGSDAGR